MTLTSSLGKLIFKKIFFGYIIIAAVLTGYQVYTQYTIAKGIISKELSLVKEAFYDVLANSVWHLNENQLKASVEAILKSNNITGVSIYTPKGEVLLRRGTLFEIEKEATSFLFSKEESVVFLDNLEKSSFELRALELSGDELLATVNLYVPIDAPFELIKKNIYLILVSAIVITIALWLLFVFYIYRIITRPIKKLTEATKTFDTKKEVEEVDIQLHNNYVTELNALAFSFNKMSKRISEDFKTQEHLNQELALQKDKLLESHRYKNFFLSNISHELKTPLNAINLISSVMARNKNNTLSEKDVENMKIISKAGNELKVLIEDILDITKIESGDISIAYQKMNIEFKIEQLYKLFEQEAKKKNLVFQMQNDLDEKYIITDEKRFTQVCKNLISNALKFTKEGFVNFKIFQREDNIVVSVEDSGIGIDEKSLETIFDKFKQVDADINRNYTGSGLGLAISKELAILLEGDIVVKTQLEKGSLFEFTFPKKNLEDISIVSVKKQQKEKVKYEVSKEEIKEEKIEVVILNTNPLLFFKLDIALKKCDFIKVVQLQSKQEFVKHKFRTNSFLIFEDSTKFIDEVKSLKEKIELTTVVVSKNKEEFYDFIIEAPIEVESVLNILKEEEKNEEV